MTGVLSLCHEKGIIDLPDTALVVGIDETGCEDYLDDNHPVFGLGGCAVLARDYFLLLDDPWKKLKKEHFGSSDTVLHASDVKRPTKDQLQALEYFFTEIPFFRFATMSSVDIKNETMESNIHLLSVSVMNQVCKFAKWVKPTEIVFICDNSDRIGKDLLKHFSSYYIGNGEYKIQPKVLLASKETKASCVEIADFVIHPAGAQVRNRIKGFKYPMNIIRKDFDTVFYRVDKKLCSYQELLSAKPKES